MILRSLLVVLFLALIACGEKTGLETVSDEVPWKKGYCKNEMQTLQSDFQAERFFSGTWYQEQSMGALLNNFNRKCITATSNYSDGTVNLTLTEYVPLIFSTLSQNVQIKLHDVNLPIFNITIPWIGMTVVNMPVSVLSTDYNNYALIYSCKAAPLGLEGVISEMAFILRRRRGDKSKFHFIREEAWKNGIIYEDFSYEDDNC